LKVSVRKPYCGSTTIPYKSTEIPDDSFPSFRQMTTAISSDIMERDKLSIRAIYHSDGSKIIETFSLSLSLFLSSRPVWRTMPFKYWDTPKRDKLPPPKCSALIDLGKSFHFRTRISCSISGQGAAMGNDFSPFAGAA
jgi:hypothetical protein